MVSQYTLFDTPQVPQGFWLEPGFVSIDAEQRLLEELAMLPVRPFEFRGYTGKRRVVSFGHSYDFSARRLEPAAPFPSFLASLRDAAAAFAGVKASEFEHALVTEYVVGSAIGWHRDRPEFGAVVGISLGSACRMRFRRPKRAGWERAAVDLSPRSAYLLTGPARVEWEHSIPPVERLRYSITFRTLRASGG